MKKQINVLDALEKAAKKYEKLQAQWNGNREFKPALKYFKRSNVFKASNVSFDPTSIEAHSYRWWVFVKVIGNQVIFNDYRYSPSTSKHQSKVRHLLEQLGVKIDLTIEAPRGLQDLNSAIVLAESRIKQIREAMANPRSRNGKNLERAQDIKKLEMDIKQAQELIKRQAFFERKV